MRQLKTFATLIFVLLLAASTHAQSKTRIIDTLSDLSGTPLQGKVTFILTQKSVTSPDGLIAAKATVSAVLTSAGRFDLSVYPSHSLTPTSYYQVWYVDNNGNQELLGIYDIPASSTAIPLTGHKVIETNLAAQYTFASKTDVTALIAAAATATTAQLYPSLAAGKHIKWDGVSLANSIMSESGATVTVAGNQVVTGSLSANGVTGIRDQDVPSILNNKTLVNPNISGVTLNNTTANNTTLNNPVITGMREQDVPTTLNNKTLNNPAVTGSVQGSLAVTGNVIAGSFVGNGASLTGIGTGTGGVLNTGSTTIAADTDADNVGVIDLQVANLTNLRLNLRDAQLFVPMRLAEYTMAARPATCLAGHMIRVTDGVRGEWACNSAGTGWSRLRNYIDARIDFGAVGDARAYQDGVATAGSTTFSSATANFTSSDAAKIIQIAEAGAGAGAAAHTTVVNGVVTAGVVDAGGSGYTSAPSVALIGCAGNNATATATISGGAVTAINITTGGTGYDMCAPSVVIGRPAHTTTIASVVNSTTVVLTAAPPLSRSSAWFVVGTDDSTAFQNALNAATTAGQAKTVYAPPGNYLFTSTLTLPANVTLKGSAETQQFKSGFNNALFTKPGDALTTTFLVTAGTGTLFTGTPFISITSPGNINTSVDGIVFYYPLQPNNAPVPNLYPPTILVGGYTTTDYTAVNASVRNSVLVNPFWGIYARLTNTLTVENVFGNPLATGIYVDKDYDISKLDYVYFTPMFTGAGGNLTTWVQYYGTGILLGRVDFMNVSNSEVIYYGRGFAFIETAGEGTVNGGGSAWAHLSHVLSDHNGWGFDIQQSQSTLGVTISDSVINGAPAASVISPNVPYGLITHSTATGQVTVSNSFVNGEGQAGLLLAGYGNNTLIGNHINYWANGGIGVQVYAPTVTYTQHFNLIGNQFKKNAQSLSISGKANGLITGNNFSYTHAASITDTSSETVVYGPNTATDGLITAPLRTLMLSGSWVNFGGGYQNAGWTVESNSEVVFRGTIKNGAISSTITTMPAGTAPPATKTFTVASNGGTCVVTINSSGVMTAGSTCSSTSLSLDGIRYSLY